jgi:hypothetical protein
MSVITDILDALKIKIQTALPDRPVRIRKSLRRMSADVSPLIIISYADESKEDLSAETRTKEFVSYTIEILHTYPDSGIELNGVVESEIKMLTGLMQGFADLTVPGVSIEDIDFTGANRTDRQLARKGTEYRILTYTITTIE